jgi:hypothetical protein
MDGYEKETRHGGFSSSRLGDILDHQFLAGSPIFMFEIPHLSIVFSFLKSLFGLCY